jgi:hypothetical protein
MILALYEDFAEEMELGIPFNPAVEMQTAAMQQASGQPAGTSAGTSKIVKIVMIESLEKTDVWEREFVLIPPGQLQIRRNHWRK